ncbi:hypothetical protein K9M79_02950 [Candidatus Woesearchaeota archaeon]|nr:hypothetical protein [Candidatus Woesearchaeota archaeon]
MEIINKDCKQVILTISNKEVTLSQVAEKTGFTLSKTQKVFNKLNNAFLIKTHKEGNSRKVKLSKCGVYYLDLFKKIDRCRG